MPHHGVVFEGVHRKIFAVTRPLEAAVRHLADQHEMRVDPRAAILETAPQPPYPCRCRTSTPMTRARSRCRWPRRWPARHHRKRVTETTGPNTSLRTISSLCCAPAMTVGSKKNPLPGGDLPPAATLMLLSFGWRARQILARGLSARPRSTARCRSRRHSAKLYFSSLTALERSATRLS